MVSLRFGNRMFVVAVDTMCTSSQHCYKSWSGGISIREIPSNGRKSLILQATDGKTPTINSLLDNHIIFET